jgi:predicted sulfurtransferase
MNFHTKAKTTNTTSIHNNNQTNHCNSCDICQLLGGRIRIASEGLNGVLSGNLLDLQEYETQLRNLLFQIHNSTGGSDDETELELDMKYCQLRTDLSITSQLFTKLQAQVTDTVVGLFDKDMIRNCVTLDDDDQEEVDANVAEVVMDMNLKSDDAPVATTQLPQQHQQRSRRRRRQQKQHSKQEHRNLERNYRELQNIEQIRTIYESLFQATTEPSSSPRIITSAYSNAPHLSPEEWNTKLQQLVLENQQVDHKEVSTITTTNTKVNHHNIVLLDCRNCYESAIGHFEVPGTTTVLTNTRKYSELPHVLMEQISNTDMNTNDNATVSSSNTIAATTSALRHASHIFMYCTGGVRCERASVFLQAALMTTSSSFSKELPQIYQLHGGIQRYLERYTDPISSPNCYFKGKNFVFDLRRTDPMTTGEQDGTVIGRCIVCHAPYDDYDHGKAPILRNETRCYKCRILILVCPHCRMDVLCWGDNDTVPVHGDSVSTSIATTRRKKKLYCGGLEPKECLYIPPVQEIFV